jgi:hypothetical protein
MTMPECVSRVPYCELFVLHWPVPITIAGFRKRVDQKKSGIWGKSGKKGSERNWQPGGPVCAGSFAKHRQVLEIEGSLESQSWIAVALRLVFQLFSKTPDFRPG